MLTSFGATPVSPVHAHPAQLDNANIQPLYEKVRKDFPTLEKLGFTLHENAAKEKRLEISAIRFPETERGSGAGSRVMKQIVDHADTNGWTLTVTPDARFDGTGTATARDQKRLNAWYKRYGFKTNSGSNRDYEISESMVREAR